MTNEEREKIGSQIAAILDEFRKCSDQNDPAISTGYARLIGASRVATAIKRILEAQ